MTIPVANLAKLSAPRMGRIYKRTQLFKELDDARKQHAVIWITAPAGAGKTTLISSYLQHKKHTPLWYKVDEGDADVASFFYYLGQLHAQHHKLKASELPVLTPEYLAGLPIFTRNFFRQFCAKLSGKQVVVLDNYQDAGNCKLHDVLPVGLQELPDKVTVIIISRSEPPGSFMRMRASGQLTLINWEQIKLSEDESLELIKLRKKQNFSKEYARQLYAQTYGWTAGLVLLLEQDGEQTLPEKLQFAEPQAIFDYFAAEILNRTEPDTRKLLLETSLWQRFDAQAAAWLTGLKQAESILDNLCQRNYFTVKNMDGFYEYHPLFHPFLKQCLLHERSQQDLVQLQKRAAEYLASIDDVEHAVALYSDVEAWDECVPLILARAKNYLQQGRHTLLFTMLNRVPENLRRQHAWLLYWYGMSLFAREPIQSQQYLEKSYEKFDDEQDSLGKLVVISSILEFIFILATDYKPIDLWLERLGDPEAIPWPDDEIRDHVIGNVLTAIAWRGPKHQFTDKWIQFEQASSTSLSAVLRIQLGLTMYHYFYADLQQSFKYVKALEKTLSSQLVHPAHQGFYNWSIAMMAIVGGDLEKAEQVIDVGEKAILENGLLFLHSAFVIARANLFMIQGEFVKAYEALEKVQKQSSHLPANISLGRCHNLTAWCLFEFNKLHDALVQIDKGIEIYQSAGGHGPNFLGLCTKVIIAVKKNEVALAKDVLDTMQQFRNEHSNILELFYSVATAYYAWYTEDKKQFHVHMQGVLQIFKTTDFVYPIHVNVSVFAEIFAAALAEGIETDLVKQLIRRMQLMAPAFVVNDDNWPYPVKLYTLGQNTLLVDDKDISTSGKGAQRPLSLLYCLIALGGRKVSHEKLIAALWPDAVGDDASGNLRTTLHRLRKLLKVNNALIVEEGRLSLDNRYVWVDVWALERQISKVDDALVDESLTGKDLRILSDAIFKLYQGPYLGQEAEQAWLLPYQERLRHRMLKVLQQLGDCWQGKGENLEAINCYNKAIEIDPLLEATYRKLMQLHAGRGYRAEALSVYQRCRKALATTLGISPSSETVDLYKQIESSAD